MNGSKITHQNGLMDEELNGRLENNNSPNGWTDGELL